ncbi:hypothetical protein ACFQ95_09470 [Variovorax sp. HJSM1_2]
MKIVDPMDLPLTMGSFARASVATCFASDGSMQTVAANVPRITHDPVTLQCLGALIEGAATNLLLNSLALSTQSVTVAAVPHTLSWFGTGSIALSGVYSSGGPVGGAGAYPARRSITFTPTAGTLTLTVIGVVAYANLEPSKTVASSWIPTNGAAATRAADVLTGTGLLYSSVPEPDTGEAPWNAGTTYNLLQTCYDPATHTVYESAKESPANLNKNPALAANAAYWNVRDKTNRWGMFDDQVSTPTTANNTIVLLLRPPGVIDTVGLMGLVGGHVTLTQHVAAGGRLISARTKSLDGSLAEDYWEWCFDPFIQVEKALFSNLAPYADGLITVVLEGNGPVACGFFTMGVSYDIGECNFGADSDFVDWSQVTRNKYGVTTRIAGNSSFDNSYEIHVPAGLMPRVTWLRKKIGSKPALYIPSEEVQFDALVNFASMSRWRFTFQKPTYTITNLAVKGLT